MKDHHLSIRQWVALGVTVPASLFLLYLLFRRRDEEENYRPSSNLASGQQLTIELKVPYDRVGSVIGQEGVTIKRIQDETQCRIKFQNESGLEEKEDRILVIRGKPDNALLAEQQVHKILAEPNAIQTLQMQIPQWAIGRIIGRGGDNIRGICRSSKARVRIQREEDRTDATALRDCVIRGTEEQIRHAKELIEEEIAHEEEQKWKLERASANRKQRGMKGQRAVGMPAGAEFPTDAATVTSHTKEEDAAKDKQPMQSMPSQEDYFTVYVSAVEHMGHFWVQVIGPKAGALDLEIQKMSEFYLEESNRQLCKPDTLCTGDIIAAPFQGDESWYRARILGFLEDGMVDLYYVDFGDSDKMSRDSLCSLRSDFLSLPHQATECSLAGIRPVDTEYSEEGIDLFEDLSYCAKWRPLMAKIIAYEQTEGGTLPCIELVDTAGAKDINIASVLVERGHAEFTHPSSSLSKRALRNGSPATPNGTPRLPEDVRAVPPEMGESEDELELKLELECAEEPSLTG